MVFVAFVTLAAGLKTTRFDAVESFLSFGFTKVAFTVVRFGTSFCDAAAPTKGALPNTAVITAIAT